MGRFDNLAGNGMFNYAPETRESGVLEQYPEGTKLVKIVRVLDALYENKETGFCVYRVEEDGRLFVVKGFFPTKVNLNGYYEIRGTVTVKDREKQLSVESYHSAIPANKDGVINLLQTLHGLDSSAHKLYAVCGPTVIEQIKNDPEGVAQKLAGSGFSLDSVLRWRNQLTESSESEDALRAILDFGIAPKKAKKLLDEYGPEIAVKIRKNPYLLMRCVDGLSFLDCDNAALRGGYSLDGIDRICEAIKWGLHVITDSDGNTCATKSDFVRASRLYSSHPLDLQVVKSLLAEAKESGCNDKMVYMLGNNRVELDIEDMRRYLAGHKTDSFRNPFQYPLFHCPADTLSQAVSMLLTSGAIAREQIGDSSYYCLGEYARYENSIVSRVKNTKAAEKLVFSDAQIDSAIQTVLDTRYKKTGVRIALEAKQLHAVKTICRSVGGIFILTGPAGSGKTFVLGIITDVLTALYRSFGSKFSVNILAPTGKAAKVAERSTGLPASTIHRFIGKVPGGAEGHMNVQAALADMFVIDEFSMVDEELFAGIAEATPSVSKILIMGDTEQLASIGAGSCLRDIIRSGCVEHIHLDVVKRQAMNSGILINANRIITGEMIKTETPNADGEKNNAYVLFEEDPLIVRDNILALAKRAGLARLQNEEVQILCPKKKGETGAFAINYIVQSALNPYLESPDSEGCGYDRCSTAAEAEFMDASGERRIERLYLQVHDRVIHTKNNYNMNWYEKTAYGEYVVNGKQGIMNGETGIIERIYRVKTAHGLVRRVIVRYGSEYVFYDDDACEQLSLAYAMTIHKSQGSQWPIVLCPITKNDYMMLNRQILYTAYTRAQDTMYLIGSRDAIARGIGNIDTKNRLTLLAEKLQGQ